MPGAITGSGTLAADAFRSLADLCLSDPNRIEDVIMGEGFVGVTGNAAVLLYGPETNPATTDGGITVAVNGGVAVGPVRDPRAGWDLRRWWVRNATAGANATVAINGVSV